MRLPGIIRLITAGTDKADRDSFQSKRGVMGSPDRMNHRVNRMKIAIIAPVRKAIDKSRHRMSDENTDFGSRQDKFDRQFRSKEYLKNCHADFAFYFLEEGPSLVLNAYDQTSAAPGVLKRALQAESEGADAIVINCTADTALRAVREAVKIPVIGPAESSMHYATMFADAFCILTFSDKINGRFWRRGREIGLESRMAEVRTVRLPKKGSKTVEEMAHALFTEISDVYRRKKCECFILGCSDFEGMAYMMGCPESEGVETLLQDQLSKAGLDIILIRPLEVAVYQAYVAALMHMHNGRISYPSPFSRM